jgi:hypothetical protein
MKHTRDYKLLLASYSDLIAKGLSLKHYLIQPTLHSTSQCLKRPFLLQLHPI